MWDLKATVVSIKKYDAVRSELKIAKRKLKNRSLRLVVKLETLSQQLQEPSFQWDFKTSNQ